MTALQVGARSERETGSDLRRGCYHVAVDDDRATARIVTRRRLGLDPNELERTIRIDPSEHDGPPVQLVVLRGAERGRVFELRGLRAILGRGAANDLVLPSKAVSQMHAALHEADGEWFIQDLDSTNGTTVAGARLPPREPRALRHGDAIGVGDQMLIFFRQERPLGDLSELLDIDVDTDRVQAEVDALLRDLPGGAPGSTDASPPTAPR